jgi:hypothetical protein
VQSTKINGYVPNKEKIGHTNYVTAPPIYMTKIWRKGFSQTKRDIHKKRQEPSLANYMLITLNMIF